MKKAIAVLVLAVFCLASTAFAATTTLTTTVPPKAHTIRLDIGTGGSVNGQRGEAELTAEHGQTLTLLVAPDRGYKLLSVVYNGEDVTARLTGGRFVIDAVESDGELAVRFAATATARNPKTGDAARPLLWTALLLAGGVGAYILRRKWGGDGA